jgi:hypothetical protein
VTRFIKAYSLDLCLRIQTNDRQGKPQLFTLDPERPHEVPRIEYEFWNVILSNQKQRGPSLEHGHLSQPDTMVLEAEKALSVSR